MKMSDSKKIEELEAEVAQLRNELAAAKNLLLIGKTVNDQALRALRDARQVAKNVEHPLLMQLGFLQEEIRALKEQLRGRDQHVVFGTKSPSKPAETEDPIVAHLKQSGRALWNTLRLLRMRAITRVEMPTEHEMLQDSLLRIHEENKVLCALRDKLDQEMKSHEEDPGFLKALTPTTSMWNNIDFSPGIIRFASKDMHVEDVLQVEFPNDVLLDIGWYIDSYRALVVKGQDWDRPIADRNLGATLTSANIADVIHMVVLVSTAVVTTGKIKV